VDPEGLAIYIKIPTRDEYEETLSSFGLGGLPDWLKDEMYEMYKNPDPSDLLGGLGSVRRVGTCGIKGVAKRVRTTLGIFPKKIGAGGKLQPYSPLTGQFVSPSETLSGRIVGYLRGATGQFSIGFAQGFASAYSGVDLPYTPSKPQVWGQWFGQMVGTIVGVF
jgi:hypothetical protein